MVAVNRKPIQVWWCNQSRCWKGESEAGVVCSSREGVKRLKFRKTVGEVEQADIIVHYRTRKGIFAISRALENGREERRLPDLGGYRYGSGWRFPAEYFILPHPITRERVNKQLQGLKLPVTLIYRNGNVRQDYLIPFSREGLQIVRQVSPDVWPLWAENVSGIQPPAKTPDDAEEGFEEGGRRSGASTIRNSKLREEAKREYGLNCYCCGFKFEEFYGSMAQGRAIVHHLETFRGDPSKQRVSTVDDVRVVCANCHYVIHLTEDPLDVDDLKRMIEQSWTRWNQGGVSRTVSSARSRGSRPASG
jgi:hypothetical protein